MIVRFWRRDTILILASVVQLILMSIIVVVTWGESPPTPACETQVSDAYRQLVADRQLPADRPLDQWLLQLNAVTSQVRIVTTQYSMKRFQAEQAEGSVARYDDQMRQMQQVNAQLTSKNAELSNEAEQLKQANAQLTSKNTELSGEVDKLKPVSVAPLPPDPSANER